MPITQNSRSWATVAVLLMLLRGSSSADVGGQLTAEHFPNPCGVSVTHGGYNWPAQGATRITYREVHARTRGSVDRWIHINISQTSNRVGQVDESRYYFLGNPHSIDPVEVPNPETELVQYTSDVRGQGAGPYYAKVATEIVRQIAVPGHGQPLVWPDVNQYTSANAARFATTLHDLGVPLNAEWCGPFTSEETDDHRSPPSTASDRPDRPDSPMAGPVAIRYRTPSAMNRYMFGPQLKIQHKMSHQQHLQFTTDMEALSQTVGHGFITRNRSVREEDDNGQRLMSIWKAYKAVNLLHACVRRVPEIVQQIRAHGGAGADVAMAQAADEAVEMFRARLRHLGTQGAGEHVKWDSDAMDNGFTLNGIVADLATTPGTAVYGLAPFDLQAMFAGLPVARQERLNQIRVC